MARAEEEGLTLIELLIAIALMGVILVPLVGGLFLALGTNAVTLQRTTDTTGGQLMSSFFTPDVQRADVVQTSGFTCSTAGTTFLELGWTDADASLGITTHVSYDLVPQAAPSPDFEITRSTYSVSPSGSCGDPVTTSVVVRAVNGIVNPPLKPPVVACTVGSSPAPCSNSSTSVMVTITALSKRLTSGSYYSPYTFQLSAARRVSP
jgi:prepilin-type N-terminal cleavage/methylation domain-containing protein